MSAPRFYTFFLISHSNSYSLRTRAPLELPSLISWKSSVNKMIGQIIICIDFQYCCSVVSDSLQPHGLQHARLPCPSPTPRVCSDSCPASLWSHPTILSSVIPSPPAFNLSQHQSLFQWVSSLHQVAKVLEFQLQHQSSQWILRSHFL